MTSNWQKPEDQTEGHHCLQHCCDLINLTQKGDEGCMIFVASVTNTTAESSLMPKDMSSKSNSSVKFAITWQRQCRHCTNTGGGSTLEHIETHIDGLSFPCQKHLWKKIFQLSDISGDLKNLTQAQRY